MPKTYQELLAGNDEWATHTLELDPHFFEDLSKGQHPEFLWIGCSDSRVPADEVTGAKAGHIFVHRNIANMVVHTDMNLLSVVNYAVEALKVKHIIVCGHYGCGGVKAAMGNEDFGFLNKWVRHIKDVYHTHEEELVGINEEENRWDRFVELNVIEQVRNMTKLSFIQEKWAKGEFPYIHGWVFSLKDGHLKNLNVTVNSAEALPSIYKINVK